MGFYTNRNAFLSGVSSYYLETFSGVPVAQQDILIATGVHMPNRGFGGENYPLYINFSGQYSTETNTWTYIDSTANLGCKSVDPFTPLIIQIKTGEINSIGFNVFAQDIGTTAISSDIKIIINKTTSVSHTFNSNSTGQFIGYINTTGNIFEVSVHALDNIDLYHTVIDNIYLANSGSSNNIISTGFISSRFYLQKNVLRPYSDISGQNWNSSPFYSKLNEISPSTGESVYSNPYPTYGNAFEVALTPTGTPNTIGFYKVRYQVYKNNNQNQLNLKVGLYDGSTLIRSEEHANIPLNPIITGFTLTSGEVSSISSFSNLRLRFESSYGSLSETYYLLDENGNYLIDENGNYFNNV